MPSTVVIEKETNDEVFVAQDLSPGRVPLILRALAHTREGYLVFALPEDRVEVLYANASFCRMTGYSVTASILVAAEKGLPIKWLTDFLAENQATMEPQQATCRELFCQRGDGSTFWAEVELVPVEDPMASLLHWVAILRDISDRKQGEQSCLENQTRLDTILDTLSDIVWSMDLAQQKFTYLSPATARIFGCSLQEFLQTPDLWRSMIHPEDAMAAIQTFNQVLTQGNFEVDYRIVRPDGEIRWLRNRAHVTKDQEGKPLHLDGIAHDITEQKRAELKIERLANFPESNPNPVYEFSPEGEVTYFNEAAMTLTKSLGEESVRAILPDDTRDIVKECLRTGKSRLRLEMPFGERTISWSFYPILRSQVVNCYAGDITEKLQLESQLRQSEKMKSIGQLAGGVAHDFNNILTIIQGYSNLLLTREDLDEEAQDQLRQVAAASQKAADLTKQLLMFSRRQVLQPKIFDLAIVVQDLAKMLRRLLSEDVQLSVTP
jgi:two-component system, cell cycle sensor histidine kinase and response regulator CckA